MLCLVTYLYNLFLFPTPIPYFQTGKLKEWYAKGHKGQLYTTGSVDFIKEVRKWVDEVKERSDRERLFLVSPGNTGLSHDQNETAAYLGDDKAQGAHSVVLLDFLKDRGAKVSIFNELF